MRDVKQVLPRTIDLLEEGRQSFLHPGAQLYVSLRGEVMADVAIGEARSGVPMQSDTLTLWLSSGKPLTALAIGQLVERSLVSFDDPVSRHIPEFAQGGKEEITLRHLLTHTAGFREADKIPESLGWNETIERICATLLEADWTPGAKAGYQTTSSWFILGELVRRLDGRDLGCYLHECIFEPLGMKDCWLSFSAAQVSEYGERIGLMYLTGRGEFRENPFWNRKEYLGASRPGSGMRGPIRELGKFYEALLAILSGNPPGSATILKHETLRQLTTRHRIGLFDQTFQHTLDIGLGFILNSNRYGAETVPYGCGRHASEDAFGHSGSQSSCAFADPAHELVVAWHCNGQPGEPRHQKRAREINSAIYEELKLF